MLKKWRTPGHPVLLWKLLRFINLKFLDLDVALFDDLRFVNSLKLGRVRRGPETFNNIYI